MATDTLIKEDLRPRRVAGALFVFLGIPFTLIFVRFGLSQIDDFLDVLLFATGPLMIIGGLTLGFPRRRPRIKLRIADDLIELPMQGKSIALMDLKQITLRRPLSGKHDRLTMTAGAEDTIFDVIQLTHEACDIINLISIRLEMQGRSLKEGRTDVLGAASGIWTVLEGTPFEKSSSRAKLGNGRK